MSEARDLHQELANRLAAKVAEELQARGVDAEKIAHAFIVTATAVMMQSMGPEAGRSMLASMLEAYDWHCLAQSPSGAH